MNISKRNDVVLEAIQSLKDGEFQATAIKLELEAQIYRNYECSEINDELMMRLGKELGWATNGCGDDDCNECWRIKAPLMYADTYNDGSVDTELTMTVSLADPSVVFKLPRVLEIFKEVCQEYGDSFDTSNAGMHIALLNDKDCVYDPANFKRVRPYDGVRFKNFSQSMIRLLPALYFLGSWNERSRELRFRRPQVCSTNVPTNHRYDPDSLKYSAVAFRHGAVEFRVFETCYDQPEAVLDYIVVMGNAMQFWTRAYTPNGLKKMPNKVKFGHDSGSSLKRFYTMEQHIDLLNAGLKILKPRYYSMSELKKQRNFDITKATLRKNRQEVRLNAAKQYEEYEKQYKWKVIYEEQEAIRRFLENVAFGGRYNDKTEAEVMALARKEGKEAAKYVKQRKTGKRKYIMDEVRNRMPKEGNYELNEDEKPKVQRRPRVQPREGVRIQFADIPFDRGVNLVWHEESN